MNLTKFLLSFAYSFLLVCTMNAQSTDENSIEDDQLEDKIIIPKVKLKDQKINSTYDGNWSIGVGINIVDDSGKQFKEFNTSENWNVSKPLVVNVEYFHNVFVSFALQLSFNEYVAGKNIDDTSFVIEDYEASYMAVDFATKFYLRDFFYPARFDAFGSLGFGYTKIGAYKSEPFEDNYLRDDLDHIAIDENGNYDVPAIGRITINAGIGFNYWLTRVWALNFSTVLKIGLGNGENIRGPNSVSNQIQYTIGTHFLIF